MMERQKYHYTEIIMQVSIPGRKMAQFQKANYKLYIEFKPSQLTTSMFSPTIVTQPHKKLPASYGTLELLTRACQCTIFHTWSFKVHILPTVFLTLNKPSLGRQRCLPSWGPRRTPWFFCNFSTVWCGRLLNSCFLGFWNYNSVIQALLVSNILCLFISTEVSQ